MLASTPQALAQPEALHRTVAQLTAAPPAAQAPAPLSAPETVADGVRLHRLSDPNLLSPPGPISVQLLEIDPRRVELRVETAADRLPAKATVPEIARQHRALAAINAGFFVVATGEAAGLLKVDGRLISPTRLPRGAVAVAARSWRRPMRLFFDQVSVRRPSPGTPPVYETQLGSPASAWAGARHAVGGAGLLVAKGRVLSPEDRNVEKLGRSFTETRHPRTFVGVDKRGFIWLITVDGRSLSSLGMTFDELQALARRLGLRDALNLDGGGSTTMVVRGELVNRPSDPTGPRPVTDAILVFSR